jgi:hypothetical protein
MNCVTTGCQLRPPSVVRNMDKVLPVWFVAGLKVSLEKRRREDWGSLSDGGKMGLPNAVGTLSVKICKDCWCRFKWTLTHYLNPGDQVLTRMLPSDADLLHTATPTPSQVRSASGDFTIFLGPTAHRCHWLHVSVRLEHFRPIGCMLLVLTGISRSRIRLSKCMVPAFWC